MLINRSCVAGQWLVIGVVLVSMCGAVGASETQQLTILMTSGSSGKLLEEEADVSAAVLAATVAELRESLHQANRSRHTNSRR